MCQYSLDIDKKASKDILSLDKLESFINNFDEEYEKS